MNSAVSLSEAWNEAPPQAQPVQLPEQRTVHVASAENTQQVDVPSAGEPFVKPAVRPNLEDTGYGELLQQLRQLREEESRRCTVYLSVGGILFALMLTYLGKLNEEVRFLNSCLLHQSSMWHAQAPRGIPGQSSPLLYP